MVNTLLLYISVLSIFVPNAQYTSTPIGTQSEMQYVTTCDEMQSMHVAPQFQSVNTYSMPNGSFGTAAACGGYMPATIQSFYSLSNEEVPADTPSLRKSPGVPTRAPMGEGVGVLLFCSTLYTLCVGLIHHSKRKNDRSIT